MQKSRFLALALIVVIALSLIVPAMNQPTRTVQAQAGVQARVTSSALTVRATPGYGGQSLGTFGLNVILEVQGREDQLGNGGIWVFGAPVGGGTQGWVLSTYLLFPSGFNVESLPVVNATGASNGGVGTQGTGGGAGITPAAVNFRSGPGLGFSVITTLAANTSFTPIGRSADGTWVKASVNGTEGWLYASLVVVPSGVAGLPVVDGTPVQPSDGGSAPAGSLSGSTTAAANFRTSPSLGASIISTLGAGTTLYFTGRTADSQWFKANVNGTEGWIFYALVAINGDRNSLPADSTSTPPPASGGTNPPPPVSGGSGLTSFAYGAHVAGFSNLNLMQYAGMTWVKVQVRFSPGNDPNGLAGMINDAHANGFRILLGIVGHPNDILGGQGYFDQYAAYVAGAAGLGADAIEIWNEQNLDREWANGHLDPALYTQLLATSYNAIKSVNRNTTVISGALAPTGAEGAYGRGAVWNDNAYLAGMRAAGAANYMDCVGAHYNEGIISPYQTSGDPRDAYYTRYFYGMINTYASIIPKPVCFTELGFLSPEGTDPLPGHFSWANNVTVAQHAQWIAEAVRIGRSNGRVRLIIIWNFNFQGSPGGDPMGGYAMLRPDGSCPACDRLAGH